MHSLRGGTVAGVHEVSFFGQDEEVTLTHRATSRQIFVNGALAAAQKLVPPRAWLLYVRPGHVCLTRYQPDPLKGETANE